MTTENSKIKITIPIRFNAPEGSDVICTEEAIEKAVNHLYKNLPITCGKGYEKKVIGTTTGNSHIATWDFENQVCKITIDGVVFYGGFECIVNEMKDGKVSDFEIVEIGLYK